MPEIAPELLRAAFVDPIRFALLVDDEFPAYDALVREKDAPARALKSHVMDLLKVCRERGWLCDVESNVEVIKQAGPHLHQSDLLIVDFHLEHAKPDDSSTAVGLLQRLAASPHFNLAIVYTSDDIHRVSLDVAFGLGGGKLPTAAMRQQGDDDLADLEGQEELAPETGVLRALVASEFSAQPLRAQSDRWQALLGKNPMAAIKAQFAAHFETRISPEVIAARIDRPDLRFDAGGGGVPWISVENLFVAVVNKTESPPEVLVDRLCEALSRWKPSALQVLMVHARAALEKVGTQHDVQVLHSPLKQAGWLFNAFSGDPAVRGKRVAQLYGSLFERMAAQLQARVGDFGRKLFEAVDADRPMAEARAWSGVSEATTNSNVVHAAHEFLSSEDCDDDGRLDTGLIFSADLGNGNRQFYVCTTPSCDLVPGQNELGWDDQIKPFKAVYAARLKPDTNEAAFDDWVAAAHHGRHLFLTVGMKPKAFEVADANTRQARLEVLFVESEARYEGRKFKGRLVRRKDDQPDFKTVEFTVIARLRPGYSNKFLMDAGMQKARIGLSWAPAPETPASAPEPVAEVAAEPLPEAVEAPPPPVVEDAVAADRDVHVDDGAQSAQDEPTG